MRSGVFLGLPARFYSRRNLRYATFDAEMREERPALLGESERRSRSASIFVGPLPPPDSTRIVKRVDVNLVGSFRSFPAGPEKDGLVGRVKKNLGELLSLA